MSRGWSTAFHDPEQAHGPFGRVMAGNQAGSALRWMLGFCPAKVAPARAVIRTALFMLVAALMGLGRMKDAYAYAIDNGYRFYSYGDASLLLP